MARNRYSAPCERAGQTVSTRPHQKLVAAVANYEAVLQHQRCSDRDQCCNDWWHYTLLVKRKLRALRNGALFTGLPPALQQLRGGLLHQAGRDRFRVQVLNTARLDRLTRHWHMLETDKEPNRFPRSSGTAKKRVKPREQYRMQATARGKA